jgi:hypothetical protein
MTSSHIVQLCKADIVAVTLGCDLDLDGCRSVGLFFRLYQFADTMLCFQASIFFSAYLMIDAIAYYFLG